MRHRPLTILKTMLTMHDWQPQSPVNFVSLKGGLNPFATSLSESRFQNLGFNSSHWHAPQIRSALNETNLLTRIFHKYETERLYSLIRCQPV